jgi:hypothetical protein
MYSLEVCPVFSAAARADRGHGDAGQPPQRGREDRDRSTGRDCDSLLTSAAFMYFGPEPALDCYRAEAQRRFAGLGLTVGKGR